MTTYEKIMRIHALFPHLRAGQAHLFALLPPHLLHYASRCSPDQEVLQLLWTIRRTNNRLAAPSVAEAVANHINALSPQAQIAFMERHFPDATP